MADFIHIARDSYIVTRNTVRVLLDSGRSNDILEAEDIVCRRAFHRLAKGMRSSAEGRWLMTHRPELSSRELDLSALRALPAGTLGYAFVAHLDRHGLDPDLLFRPLPVADEPDYAYLMRRYRGAHDIWHTLLGLGTEGYEEVLVHAFGLGHLNLPVSQLICLFGIPKHMLFEGRFSVVFGTLRQAFLAGRRAAPLLSVRWEVLWDLPLDAIRLELRVPCLR